MDTSRARCAHIGALLGTVVLLVGCTTYEAKPLDEPGHLAAWRSRSVEDASIQELAARLGLREAQGSRFDPSDGLTAREAELVALCFNPDLRLARLRAGVTAAGAEHAGRWDDPEFGIEALRVTQSVPDRWIVSPSLAVTIPLSGRLAAERDLADAELRVARAGVVEAEWAVRHEVRVAWLEWSAAMLRQEQLAELLDSVRTLSDTTARLADAGEMLRTEAALFSIERVRREHELTRRTGQVREAEQHLRAVMGLAPDAPVTLLPSLARGHDEAVPTELEIAPRNPSLARLREQYQVAEHALRTEIRKQYPDLTIGPVYEYDQGQSSIGLLAGIPVPVLNANRRGIAQAAARRELARAEFEATHERLIGTVAAARARLGSLAAERDQILMQLAPLVEQQLRDATQLLELGEGGGLVLLESIVRSHDTRIRLIEVGLEEALAAADLVFLIGPPAHHNHPHTPTTGTQPG